MSERLSNAVVNFKRHHEIPINDSKSASARLWEVQNEIRSEFQDVIIVWNSTPHTQRAVSLSLFALLFEARADFKEILRHNGCDDIAFRTTWKARRRGEAKHKSLNKGRNQTCFGHTSFSFHAANVPGPNNADSSPACFAFLMWISVIFGKPTRDKWKADSWRAIWQPS